MVWMEKNTVSLRQEFVQLARQEGANKRELCRRFGISPKTGYKWLARFDADPLHRPAQSLADRSRRPHKCTSRSPDVVEQAVVSLRLAHPAWGGRKIAQRLVDLGQAHVAPSTVTHILHRHGLITPEASCAAQPWQRFEHEQPNSLWQMDFKGHFPTLSGLCYPFTVLDDHSRFSLAIHALVRTDTQTVQAQLVQVFRRYGLPTRINTDNGAPWGCPSSSGRSLSELAVWLIRLGVRMSFSAPRHPQTNGKLERLHRSLNTEVIAGRNFKDHACAQAAFDEWREVYNCQRPHHALAQQVPARRYRISPLAYPDALPDIAYPDTDLLAKPNSSGFIHFQGRRVRTSSALRGLPVGIRPNNEQDGLYDVYFCHQRFMQIDMREPADT